MQAAGTQMPPPHVVQSPAVNNALTPSGPQLGATHAQAPIFNGTSAAPPFTMQSHQPLGAMHPPSMAMQAPPQQAPPPQTPSQLMTPTDAAPLLPSTPANQLGQHTMSDAVSAQSQSTHPSELSFDGMSNASASPLPPQQQMANTLGSMQTTLDNVSVNFSRDLRDLQTSIATSIDTKIEASSIKILEKMDSMNTCL